MSAHLENFLKTCIANTENLSLKVTMKINVKFLFQGFKMDADGFKNFRVKIMLFLQKKILYKKLSKQSVFYTYFINQ